MFVAIIGAELVGTKPCPFWETETVLDTLDEADGAFVGGRVWVPEGGIKFLFLWSIILPICYEASPRDGWGWA